MKLILLVILTSSICAFSQEANGLIQENIKSKHQELVKMSLEHGVEKYNYARKYRKKFLSSMEGLEVVNESTKDFFKKFLNENPAFRPARVKNINGHIIMIYKGNKIKMSYADYVKNQYFVNRKMVKFDINNDIDRELDKIKRKYRSRGIPILTTIGSAFISDAHAFGNDNKSHYALGLSFYNLLYKVASTNSGLMVDFFEELNEGLHLHFQTCQKSNLDEDKFNSFIELLNDSNDSSSSSLANNEIKIDSCSSDIEDSFSKSPVSSEQSDVIEKVCSNIKILDNCIAGLHENNKLNVGRVPASESGFIETEDIQVE